MGKIIHIGKSSKEENEILNILSEESAEIIQAISKVFRFGWQSAHPDDLTWTNKMHLEEEIGDMLCMVNILFDKGIIDQDMVQIAAKNKLVKLKKYSDIKL